MNTPTSRCHHHVSTAPAADAPGSCNWLTRHFHRTPAAGWGLLLLCLVFVRTTAAQEPVFRVGDMVRSSHYLFIGDSLDRHFFDSWSTTTVLTHGAGITNEIVGFSTWSLLSYNSLPAYYNRYSFAMWQWSTNIWTWQNDSYLGSWNYFKEIDRDNFAVSLNPLVLASVWQTNEVPFAFSGPVAPPDFFGGFKGPVGTISTTNEFGATTTDTYTTTAGIYIPGDPASTNDSFYRVHLCLTNSAMEEIGINFAESYLGQLLDTNGNVYVWLREGQSYTAKPVFRNFTPAFYSYNAELTPADKLGTLLITTIKDMGGSWPGTPPPGVFQRLGYPASDYDPTGDQIAFDILLNTPVAELFNAAIALAVQLRGLPLDWAKDTNRGSLATLTEEDRKYVTMVFLKRSANPDPQEFLTHEGLDAYTSFTNRFGYRLINELSVEASAYQSAFGHNVTGRNLLRRQSKIGNTRLTIAEPVDLRLIIYPGTAAAYPVTITLDEGWVNPIITGMGTIFQNDPGGGHDRLIGGATGSDNVYNVTAGRAGWLLRQVEEPLLRRTPPDFFSWIIYHAKDNSVSRGRRLSAWTNSVPEVNVTRTWPAAFEYHYEWGLQFYERKQSHSQMETPFLGFLLLGP